MFLTVPKDMATKPAVLSLTLVSLLFTGLARADSVVCLDLIGHAALPLAHEFDGASIVGISGLARIDDTARNPSISDDTTDSLFYLLDFDAVCDADNGVDGVLSHSAMAFGPTLDDRPPTLVMLSDNDGNRDHQLLDFAVTMD